jgi:hypothetical protein
LLTIMIMNGCWLIVVLLCLYSGLHFVSFIKSFLCFHIKISLYSWEESIHIIHAYLLHAAKMHKSWVYVYACIHVTTTQVKITFHHTWKVHYASCLPILPPKCLSITNLISITIVFFFLVGLVSPQGFVLAKQALYCLSHTSSPFFRWLFWIEVPLTICLSWPQTTVLPISASQVSRITSERHWYWWFAYFWRHTE